MPLLSAQLCNSSCVYGGALTPRMLCAGYLDGRADACQVWRRGQCWRAGAGVLLWLGPWSEHPRWEGRGWRGSTLEAGGALECGVCSAGGQCPSTWEA